MKRNGPLKKTIINYICNQCKHLEIGPGYYPNNYCVHKDVGREFIEQGINDINTPDFCPVLKERHIKYAKSKGWL